jgi:transcription elongation factor Elf1
MNSSQGEVKMKFVCPICETDGSIAEDDLTHPITKATCRQCGTILLVDAVSGNVDAHKSPLRGTREFALSVNSEADTDLPVLKMRAADPGSRDWTAIIIVLVVLSVLISAGVYFTAHLDTLQQTFQTVSELIEGLLRSFKAGV